MNYEEVAAGVRLLVWRVRLDFSDFRQMEASREVRKSFDAGFTTLHELLHGFGYKDAADVSEVGECEEMINQARANLGLMVRDQYFGDPLRIAPQIITVRLRFRRRPTPSEPVTEDREIQRTSYLFFLLPPGYEQRPLREVVPVSR